MAGRITRFGPWVACFVAALLVSTIGLAPVAQIYHRPELIEDARQLLAILEDNHPDPYFHGGGKVAFRLRFQELLRSIPADGMTADAFTELLLPFVASVGDGHTTVWDWENVQLSSVLPGGVPLRFEVVEQSLYVAAVPLTCDRELIGSILLSVEGVSVEQLRVRQRRRRGIDNEYGELCWLIDGLWYGPRLTELLPEWTDRTTVRVTLRHPDGAIAEHEFRTPVYSSSLRRPAETVVIPEPGPSGFGTGFLDDEGRVAILRVDDMTGYREVLGRTGPTSHQEIPNDVLAATPSATEVFRQLVIDMKESGTETLLIDLRRDHGGASLMSDILVYFLYGKDVLLDVIVEPILNGGGQIERLGPLEMKYYSPDDLAELSAQHGFPLQTGDFNTAGYRDFYAAYAAALELTLEELVEQQGQLHLAGQYDDVPVFSDEFASGEYAGHYTPENVIVLVSAHTYSSGYTMMRYLSSAGATLVGTPSSQAANCIGEGLSWELDHTGIRGLVAHNIYAHCPDDPERGRVWPVDVPLTHDELAAHGFDPNTEVLLALEWIEAQEEAETVARLEMKVESLRDALRIPGLSAAVVKDGELIWAKGFGYANLKDQVEATAETPYGLASVTKPFAAILLMRLVEDGLLDLDTPVREFGIDLGNDEITIRHLLSHTSEGTPGSRYQYSGNRYSYLTSVIELLYGGSFRRVLREEILEPLGMTDTALNVGGCGLVYYLSTLAPDDPERAFEHVYRSAATPYLYDRFYDVYPVPVPSYANAAAGLISTVVDLARFAAAIEQDALVASEMKERMFTPTRLASGEVGPYGLGWFTETYGETELIWHYGYGAYSSLFLMAPDEGLTFIVLANTQNLSRPFGLGGEDASVLASPLALAFFKEFVVQPEFEEPLPEIDWVADTHAVVEQLGEITDEDLRDFYERELWAYRKLYAGVGRKDVSFGLRGVHAQAFGGSEVSRGDLYEVELPGPRPPEAALVALTDAEAARWIGRYRLRPEDAASGLPLEIEIGVYGDRILAISGDHDCQELLPLSPVRAVTAENPDLFLLAEGAEGPFTGAVAEYGGALMGTYERIVASENEEKNE
jgi:CubicO group peptidase (beta-lactamase class C family)